jgi:hypothetical protein
VDENRIAGKGRIYFSEEGDIRIYVPVEIAKVAPYTNKEKVKVELFKKEKKIVISRWEL